MSVFCASFIFSVFSDLVSFCEVVFTIIWHCLARKPTVSLCIYSNMVKCSRTKIISHSFCITVICRKDQVSTGTNYFKEFWYLCKQQNVKQNSPISTEDSNSSMIQCRMCSMRKIITEDRSQTGCWKNNYWMPVGSSDVNKSGLVP